MTRTVNGHDVLTDEPTPAPFRNGHPVYRQQTRTLQLSNGDTIYGCAHCDYTSDNWRSIRPHLSVHKEHDGTGNRNDADDLLAQLSKVKLLRKERDHMNHDRDRWKRDALKANAECERWKHYAQGLEQQVSTDQHRVTSAESGEAQPLARTSEVAEYLALPQRTLTQWRYERQGPPWIHVGRHVRYRWSSVEKWLNQEETDEHTW